MIEKIWNHYCEKCIINVHGNFEKEVIQYRCAYVVIKKNHPWIKKEYGDIHKDVDLDVHCGLTFSSYSLLLGDREWLIGFDCAHLGDRDNPFYKDDIGRFADTDHYWTLEDMIQETNKLAKQVSNNK